MSKHIIGKAYELTQRNFNRILGELEAEQAENRELQNYVVQLEERVELMEEALHEAGYIRAYSGDEEIWINPEENNR